MFLFRRRSQVPGLGIDAEKGLLLLLSRTGTLAVSERGNMLQS